jgi:hypothetical protein
MFRSLTARRFLLRSILASTVCTVLVLPGISSIISKAAPGQSAAHTAQPQPGKPEGVFPDLAEIKNESDITREPAMPIPSTMRSPKNPLEPQFPDRKAQEKNRSSVRWSSYFHDILNQLCIE